MPGFKKRLSSQSQAIVSSDIHLEYPLQGSMENIPHHNENTRSVLKNKRVTMLVFVILGTVLGLLITVASIFMVKEVRQSLFSQNQETVKSSLLTESTCKSSVCYKASNFISNYLNQTVDPCSDFYQFACGFAFDDRDDDVDHFSMAHDHLLKDLFDILSRPLEPSAPKSVNNFRTLYRSCLDEDRIETNSDKELTKYLTTELGEWSLMSSQKGSSNNNQLTIENYIAKVTVLKSPLLFRFQSDIFNFTKITMRILTPADYCKLQNFIPDGSDQVLVKRFKKFFQQMYEYLNEDEIFNKDDGLFNQQFDDMLSLAQKIYFTNSTKYKCGKRRTDVEIKQLILTPQQLNNEINAKVRAAKLSEFDFMLFLNHTGIEANVTANMQIWITSFALEYVKDVFYNLASSYRYKDDAFRNTLRNFAHFHTVLDLLYLRVIPSAPLFPLRYYQALYEYLKYVEPNVRSGSFYRNSYSTDREKACTYLFISEFDADGMGEDLEFQKFYLSEKFNALQKNQTREMITEMVKSSDEYIDSLEWIDGATKKLISLSLQDMKFQTAFSDSIFSATSDDEPLDYASEYAVNLLILRKNNFEKQFRYLNQDQYEHYRSQNFIFNIFLANLMYSKEYNTILVPAGVLMQPIFHIDLPNYMNYATVGVYISHEIWHMVHEVLLASTSSQSYLSRINSLTESYSAYAKEKYNYDIEAQQAIDEQIADYFGVKIAFKTYQKLNKKEPLVLLPGLNYSQEQLFFIRYSQSYCRKRSNLNEMNFERDHGVEEFRVFETVLQGEFNKAFKCQEKTQKYQMKSANTDLFDGSSIF